MDTTQLPPTSTSESVPRRAPETLVQHFDEESLLMDPASQYTCALNPTGAAVWELIDGSRSVAEIAALIARSTAAEQQQTVHDVRHFIDEMSRLGFVRLGSDDGEAGSHRSFAASLKRLNEAVHEEAQRYQQEVAEPCKLFVASEPSRLFGALQAARRHTSRFIELGSGLGGITLLAALIGYERATGIEHDAELTRRATQLAQRLGLAQHATFHTGNYFPADHKPPTNDPATSARYHFDGESRFTQLGVPSYDCWLATPFPNTQHPVEQLFDTHAKQGALLLIYQGIGPVTLRTTNGATLTYHGPESDADLAQLMNQDS